MRKKALQLTSLESQLDDKVCEVAQYVSKVSDLEEEVQVKAAQLKKVRGQLEERSDECMQHDAMLNKMKQLNKEQFGELEQQIDMVSSICTTFFQNETSFETTLNGNEYVLTTLCDP